MQNELNELKLVISLVLCKSAKRQLFRRALFYLHHLTECLVYYLMIFGLVLYECFNTFLVSLS